MVGELSSAGLFAVFSSAAILFLPSTPGTGVRCSGVLSIEPTGAHAACGILPTPFPKYLLAFPITIAVVGGSSVVVPGHDPTPFLTLLRKSPFHGFESIGRIIGLGKNMKSEVSREQACPHGHWAFPRRGEAALPCRAIDLDSRRRLGLRYRWWIRKTALPQRAFYPSNLDQGSSL